MVGIRRQCNIDHASPPVWQDPDHEHDRTVFFIDYAGRGDLFENLSIWQDEKYQRIQGTYPVISLSFANVKEQNFVNTRKKICQILTDLYTDRTFLLESPALEEARKAVCGIFDFKGNSKRTYPFLWLCFSGEKGINRNCLKNRKPKYHFV